VPGYTRQQLKQDRFAETAQETVSWAIEHRNKLIVAGVVVTVFAGILIGGWIYLNQQDQKASVAFGSAIATYQSPLRPANAPAQPDVQTFTSAAQRAEAAEKQFQAVVDQYPHTRSAEFARYFVGLTYRDMGKNTEAEKYLKDISGVRNQSLASLAKFALAGIYAQTNRQADAIKMYQDLIAHPTTTVPKTTAQLELATLYEAQQPAEAAKIYQDVRKAEPQSVAAEVAGTRLAAISQK
jgi:tetratricopeptide (TPR) repeat protein